MSCGRLGFPTFRSRRANVKSRFFYQTWSKWSSERGSSMTYVVCPSVCFPHFNRFSISYWSFWSDTLQEMCLWIPLQKILITSSSIKKTWPRWAIPVDWLTLWKNHFSSYATIRNDLYADRNDPRQTLYFNFWFRIDSINTWLSWSILLPDWLKFSSFRLDSTKTMVK